MKFLSLIVDFFKYPFDEKKESNQFHQFLQFLFKEYPAFLREKPSIRRVLLWPFLVIYRFFLGSKSVKNSDSKSTESN